MENHIGEALMILLSKMQVAVVAIVSGVVGMFFLALNDSYMIISISYGALILNWLSGIALMFRDKLPWDEKKLFKTAMKLTWFGALILTTKAAKMVYEIDVPVAILVSALLTGNELRSWYINTGDLMGITLWGTIVKYVDIEKITDKLFGSIKKDGKKGDPE